MISRNFVDCLTTVNLKHREINYNFLDVIRKADNENIVSDWLAFLLDTKKCGSVLPLKLFCNSLGIEYVGGELEIEREYTLDNRRRIDILIKLENAWIVIENKINSMECNEQTVDYEEKITSKANGQNVSLHYVYLKPSYNKSTPTNKSFEIMTYGNLADIWKDVVPNDFVNKENYVYFSEFIKLITKRYAMNKEIQFDENTKLYIAFREQFNAAEQSFNDACQVVRDKLLNSLKVVFSPDEGWVVSFHSEYIQFYKTNWGSELHFEIGTWAWQRNFKNISFNRLIADDVKIDYCLHAERTQTTIYGYKFQEIVCQNKQLFDTGNYNFDNEDNCIFSINAIVERLQNIKNSIAPIIDNLLTVDTK